MATIDFMGHDSGRHDSRRHRLWRGRSNVGRKHKSAKPSAIALGGLVGLLALGLANGPVTQVAARAAADPFDSRMLWLPLLSRPALNPVHQGIATYYDATGAGACSFDPSPNDLMVAAMNAEEFNNAAVCGSFIAVSGPKGSVTIRIVDLCPECKAGHLDLSQQAFAKIADLPLGRVNITWQLVSPALSGPIAYHFKDGSNQWWTAVQIRNHRNSIAKLEYRASANQWVSVPRTDYNYFVQTNPGMGPGPYSFRVTDVYGNVLTDDNIPHQENGTLNGVAQFPSVP